jgi:ABC-2 type transport system ATP-binding protein
MSVLSVRNLTKKYSESFTAVNNISFSIEKGEALGILGSNGAGKTTTIHMLLSTLTPTSGTINYFGKDFFTHRSEILQHVGFGTTYARLPGRLTVAQNLDIYGRLYGLTQKERLEKIQELLELLDMWHLRDRSASALSAGEMTRAILAKAFIADPTIVLLDEPTASLDIDVAQTIRNFICKKRDAGVSFLLASHNMDEMTHVCDRIIVMQKGKIIDDSTPKKLSQKITHAFLELVMDTTNLKKSIVFAEEKNIPFTTNDISITFKIDEHTVAKTLQGLSQSSIDYMGISIKKPSLQDYFLSIANKGKQ